MASLDTAAFLRRLERLYTDWESLEDTNQWNGVDCVAVAVGRDDVVYSKSTALQTWLFGYELTDTLCLLCADEFHILTSKKKADFLKPLAIAAEKNSSLPKIVTHLRNKGDGDKENFQDLLKSVQGSKSGRAVGIFAKDSFTGELVEGWKSVLSESSLDQIDVSAAFAYMSATKDPSELEVIKQACLVTCTVFNKHVKKEIVTIVDEEKRVKHSKLTDGIDKAVTENKKLIPAGIDHDQVEICYSPIVQSGGNYQLKFSTVSSDERLHFGTILCFLGIRYKSYCSNVCRTMFVQPTQDMQDNYSFLLTVYDKLLETLQDGVTLSDVYSTVVQFVEEQKPHLKDYFTKSLGFATGLEFREPSLVISPKCSLCAKEGMVFCINIGFANLSNPQAEDAAGKVYALFIGDTVLVNNGSVATELTSVAKKKISNIAIFLGSDEDDDNVDVAESLFSGGGERGTAVLDSRTRTEISSEGKRKAHQNQLGRQINDSARKRMLEGLQDTMSKRPKLSSSVAYKHQSALPTREQDVQDYRLFVDRRHEALIIPMYGTALPFHVSTIKSISKSEEGHYTYLRLNFFFPGSTIRSQDGVIFPNTEATFIKELSLRGSSNVGGALRDGSTSLVSVYQLIKDVQKKYRTHEQEKKELEGVVEQDQLIVSTSKGNPRLTDLYMRPVLGSRRVQGVLEGHINGLRYRTMKGDKVDIIYNNIKHAFFQPSKGEMIVVLHFNLKSPIITGKKKHKDIQFYTEVGEIMTDLGRTHHMHDRDDLMAEQGERELRQKLDGAFDNFRRRIESLAQSNISFEKPFRELGFPGVPARSTVFLMPTTNCLVSLTEPPPFVITLDEVQLVHFERVQFHLKNFDMVYVFKDYKKKVAMINAIPMKSLDQVKEWLNSCDIKYTEGIQSLNWSKIMKTINDDPEGFFDSGGWSFLDPESDNEEEGSEEEQSDEYVPTDEESVELEEEDSDEDYSSVSEASESEYEDDDDSEDESGKDWDELEEEAVQADKERYSDEEESSSRKLSHSSQHRGQKPSHKQHKSPHKGSAGHHSHRSGHKSPQKGHGASSSSNRAHKSRSSHGHSSKKQRR